jgi:hypothetical protein
MIRGTRRAETKDACRNIERRTRLTRHAKAKPTKSEPRKTGAGVSRPTSPAAPPAEPERDIEALRYSLARKLMLLVSDWRRCPKPACKRRRGCAAPGLDCHTPEPERAITPEQEDAAMAHFQRALQKRLAQLGGGR